MKKKIFGFVALTVVAATGFAACGGGGNTDSTGGGNSATETEDLSKFPLEMPAGEAKEGGTLDVAVVTDTQFQGLFMWEYYQDNYDAQYMEPSHEGLFLVDKDFKIVDGGIANLEIDPDANTATIKLRDNVKWSDGEPLTADDVIFSYEIIGDKDYTGIRYDNTFTNIVGMEDFHDQKADTISGITKEDDHTVKIQYKEVNPGMQQAGGGVWSYAAPKHVLKDIPVKDMESSDPVRKSPVTLGPYKMTNIKPGESVEYTPNEFYYGDKPKLDKVVFKSVPSASIVEALNSKQYDMAKVMPTDTYPSYKDLAGYTILGREEQAYTYIGFKLGKWNADEGKVEYNPNSKMADKSLRQAMGYALNNDSVGEKFYNGLRTGGTTLIPPVFGTLHDKEIKGYTEDLDKANKLLDDAGYKDTNGDGIREDKDGKELVIKFASMSGGETAQPLADYYVQQWEKVGLKVEYATGRLIDFQAFYDKLKNDDPEIDVFQGAWGTGSDPSPTGLYGPNSAFNYTRFESEENTKLLAAIDSKDSFDDAKRKEAFDAWQEYAFEEAYVIPTLYRNELLPMNNRVTGFTWAYDTTVNPWATIGVTSDDRQ
ncbi:peptide ABC transporter substrate-binding protein [Enterococcus canis]|uniref:Peptide ABC transporter substrate-binding protein n=1 Tax=Enterococcus canis TaxID=214095 RepID=A0A1L8RGF4_9ENTE|nr:oligopeptide ABC transporter substrate-binding protein [Enterococcus canis]OJG18849.1 peptide ABC transporter substrate-binding protein [Enterococcus canis]